MKICTKCGYEFNNSTWLCPSCFYKPRNLDGFLVFSPNLNSIISTGFDPKNFSELFFLESNHFWFRARNKLILLFFNKYLKTEGKFLEIGCGTGFVTHALEKEFPNLHCYASEVFIEGLKYARKRLSKTFLFQMDARKIPFRNEFDTIGAFDVLEHISEDETVLQQIYQALKPSGHLILTVPQHPWLWSKADEFAHHVRRYTFRELESKLKQAGFRIIRMTSFISLLLPLMIASRLRGKNSQNYDPRKELRINKLLNFTLEGILDLEIFLIRYGISFPMGGSLAVVAFKS